MHAGSTIPIPNRSRRNHAVRAGRTTLAFLILAAALLAIALGTPETTSADGTSPTVTGISITSNPGPDNEYHTGDTITVTMTFSVEITTVRLLTLDIGIGSGTCRVSIPSTPVRNVNSTSTSFSCTVTDAHYDADGITLATNAMDGYFSHPSHSGQDHRITTIPNTLATAQAGHKVNVNTIDYDTDDDGLIEIKNLAQLNAIRWDLNGNGTPTDAQPDVVRGGSGGVLNPAGYAAAFPKRSHYHGCPDTADAGTDPGPCLGYELAADLDFDTDGDGAADAPYASWNPIGNGGDSVWPYSGTFQGNQHTIANLTINFMDTAQATDKNVGLFGGLGQNGVISGVILTGASVSYAGTRTESATGILAGVNDGTITDCSTAGSVSGGSAASSRVGGLVGINGASRDATIRGSYSTATVTASGNNSWAGGLVATSSRPNAVIAASYATGAVTVSGTGSDAGGLLRRNTGSITASYAAGAVTAGSGSGAVAGGLAATNAGTITASYSYGAVIVGTGGARGGLVATNSGTVTNSYWDTTTTSIAHSSSAPGAGEPTTDLQSPTNYGATATDIYQNWNVDVDGDSTADDPWNFGTASQYPALHYGGRHTLAAQGRTPDDYDYDNDGLIDIYTLEQLNAIRHDPDGNGQAAPHDDYLAAFPNRDSSAPGRMGCPAGDCAGYELMASLDFDDGIPGDRTDDTYYNGGAGWVPILNAANTGYSGVFEGNGNTIANLYINFDSTGNNFIGLFGRLGHANNGEHGEIRGVGITDARVTGATTGWLYVGALVGWNNNGAITASYATGSVSGNHTIAGSSDYPVVGGLVGSSGGGSKISASYATASATASTDYGNAYAGGLAGVNSGGVINACYATGAAHATTGGDSVAVFAGGLVAASLNSGARITASYATGVATGDATGDTPSSTAKNLGGLAGQNTSSGRIVNSYWDTNTGLTAGIGSASGGMLDNAVGQTSAALRQPTGYAGIYANWNVDIDGDDRPDNPWRFGNSRQYPILYYARDVGAGPAADFIADDSGAETAAFVDYDADNDGLIEVASLEQLSAIRYDLNGDGTTSNPAYDRAFPNRDPVAPNANGCVAACRGYELAASLDFDTNRNGRTHTNGAGDSGDAHYNGGAGWTPIGGHADEDANNQPYAAIFEGNGHTISNLYLNLSTTDNAGGYYVGLFSRLSAGAVRNLGLVNPYVKNARAGGGAYFITRFYTGALAGWISRNVTVSGSYVSGGSVEANQGGTSTNLMHRIAGCLLGSSWGAVSDSWASCAATATGTVTNGNYYAGGLLGEIGRNFNTSARYSTVRDSYAAGAVTVRATNTIRNNSAAGGLAARMAYDARVDRSYATGAVTNNGPAGYTGGLLGSAVTDSNVSDSFATGAVTGMAAGYVGGLVGFTEDAHVTASYATGAVRGSGSQSHVGGLMGRMRSGSSVHTSFAIGPVTASGASSSVGGLVGLMEHSQTSVTHSYATGAVSTTGGGANHLGGLVGQRGSGATSIDRCYAIGAVSAAGTGHNLGGLVGNGAGTITASYWNTETTGQATSAGAGATGKTTAELQGPTDYGSAADDIYMTWGPGTGDPWNFGTATQYPILQYRRDALGIAQQMTPRPGAAGYDAVDYDRDGDGLIEVANLDQLDAIRHDLDGNGSSARTVAAAARYLAVFPGLTIGMGCAGICQGYELANDLDFARDADYANWIPIGTAGAPYAAVFRGNGHTLDNLDIDASNTLNVGLFGVVSGANAVIESVALTDVSITATATGNAAYLVGALAGNLGGAARASYATGEITVNASGALPVVRAGGLAGQAQAASSIVASYAGVDVTANSDVSVSAGGLVGWASGSVTAAYATGTVASDQAASNRGGLFGVSDGVTASASYWDTNATRIADDADDAPPEGKSASALQSPTAYRGIYATWNDHDLDGDGRPDAPWDFGDACQYPALEFGGLRPARQRGSDPPCPSGEYVAPPIVYNLNIRFSVRGISLDEGQSAAYRVRMSERPAGHPARVTISSNNPDVTVAPTELRFAASDYNQWQTVVVTALRDANDTDESANLAHRGPNNSYGSIIVSVNDVWPGAVTQTVNGRTVTRRYELAAPPGVAVTLTSPDTLDTDPDITIGGPPADAPDGAPGYGLGQSAAARTLASIRVRGAPAAGLTICLPASAELLAEAGEHPLTLLRYAAAVWTPVAGSERRVSADGTGITLVCADGVTEYGLFAVAYTLPELGAVSDLAAAPGAAPGALTLTWTPGANATAHWIAGVKQATPYDLAIWEMAGSPGSHTITGLDSGASYILTVTAGRGEGDSSQWTAWAPYVYATPD